MTALLSGYRGTKVHAVDVTTPVNAEVSARHGEGVALCGWPTMVGDVEFRANGLACRNCARAAVRLAAAP